MNRTEFIRCTPEEAGVTAGTCISAFWNSAGRYHIYIRYRTAHGRFVL